MEGSGDGQFLGSGVIDGVYVEKMGFWTRMNDLSVAHRTRTMY